MRNLLLVLVLLCALPKINNGQIPPNLGEAARYIFFTQIGAISNVGTSTITGDVGNNVGVVSGFGPPTIFTGTIQNANSSTWQAEYDIAAALGQLSIQVPTASLPLSIGGGQIILPGVYNIFGACSISGDLILDGGGDVNAVFIFQVTGALTTSGGSTITLINGAKAGNVFWAVTGAASVGALSSFSGTIIAKGAIAFGAGSSLTGRALGTVGAVSVNAFTGSIPDGPYITTIQPDCLGNVGAITINAPVGAGFTYSIGGAFQSSPTFSNLSSGTYPITVKNNFGAIIVTGISTVINPQYEPASPFSLGEAGNFVLFSSSGAVSNTSTSYIPRGDIGTNFGAVSGMGLPTVVVGSTYVANAITAQASLDVAAVYLQLNSEIPTALFPAAPYDGQVLTPGVYSIAGASAVAGNLVLDGGGDPTSIFVFQIGGAFSLGAGAAVILTNGASASRIFWVVNGAVAMAGQTTFSGTIVNNAAISFGDGSIFTGRALSTIGAVSIYGTLVNAPFQCYSASPLSLTLRLKVLLQGAVLGNTVGLESTMRDSLRSNITGTRFIPDTDPYTSNITYSGLFTKVGDGLNAIYQTVLSPATMFDSRGTSSAVDWVFIELRNKIDPAIVLGTRSAIMQRDGTVVDINGSSDIRFLSLLSDDYYVAVRHRNHLGAMTATALPSASFNSATVVDFTIMTDADLWNNAGYDGLEQAILPDGKRALWAGNANGDNKVKYQGGTNDRTLMQSDVINFINNTTLNINYDLAYGYFQGDINMDSKVKYQGGSSDRTILQSIVLGYLLNTSFSVNYDLFLQQLP
ncbi:MAG: ice-binding family protein [Bacteroidota bacterium]